MKMVAANVDRVLPSNDRAVYVETKLGAGEVYTGVVTPVIAKA